MTDNLLDKEIIELKNKIKLAQLPQELSFEIERLINRLERIAETEGYSSEFDKTEHYIDWVVNLPWNKKSEAAIDLTYAKEIFEKNHYGIQDVKERIIEYLSVVKLHREKMKAEEIVHAPIICLVGLVGTGKTTFAYSIAEALKRPFVRIPFGGMGSAKDLRGQSRQHDEAEPGYIIKALRRVGVKNPIMLLDEIDRVSEAARADIMGVLVELLDPEQNQAFIDHYLDYPFDLSEVLFIGTANNTTNIATAVMDRLEPISMPAYSDDEKTHIARDYLLPEALEEAGLSKEQLIVDENLWPRIVRPLGFDAGIRTLQRNIKAMTRKVARLIVAGEIQSVHLTQDNVEEYIPKQF